MFLKAEGLEHAVKVTLGGGDGDAVVGDGDAGFGGLLLAPEHEGAVDHAAAAVDDEGVGGEIGGEVAPGGHIEDEVFAGGFAEKGGDFNAANIFLRCMVGAGFGNEDAGAFL